MLELLKMLIGKEEETAVLQYFLELSTATILNYTKLDGLDNSFDNAVVFLASYLYNNKSNLNIGEKVEGERRLSFLDREIPKEILAMLPYPKARFF